MPSTQQLEFQKQLAGKSQAQLILERLKETPRQWVGVLELHQLSGSLAVHSRINDLRAAGHWIDQQSEYKDGKNHSSYRWLKWESKSL